MKLVASDIEIPPRVAIIGAGLLGGSFGLAIREHAHSDRSLEVIGVSRSAASRDAAMHSGAVTAITDCVEEACEGAGLVVVAVPVDGIASMVFRAVESCADDALVIDLGSTKASIVRAIDKHARAPKFFVGTHPIAGSEKTGAEFARAELFAKKTVIITPGESTPDQLVERARALWLALRAHVVVMTPEQHDVAMASVSHVPHIVASMLAGLLGEHPAHGPAPAELVGSGWLDTTRVASGDPDLWTAICRENAPAIQKELAAASTWLQTFAQRLAEQDFASVREMLEQSRQIRDRLLAAKGLTPR